MPSLERALSNGPSNWKRNLLKFHALHLTLSLPIHLDGQTCYSFLHCIIHGPVRANSGPIRAIRHERVCALMFFQFCEIMLSWPYQGQNQKKKHKKWGGVHMDHCVSSYLRTFQENSKLCLHSRRSSKDIYLTTD